MSTVIASDKISRWAVFTIIFSLSMLAISIMIITMDTSDLKLNVQKELIATKSSFTNDSWELIESKTRSRYQTYFFDSGVFDFIYGQFSPGKGDLLTRYESRDDEFLTKTVNNIQIFAYQIFFRISVLEYWLALLLPLAVCLISSGYFQWRKKLYKLGGASTGRGRLWLKIAWLLLVSFISLLFTPTFVASMTVYFPALLIIVSAVAIGNYISHFAKSF